MLQRGIVLAAALCAAALGVARIEAQTLVAEYRFDNAGNLGLDTSGLGNHATNTAVTQGLDRFGALSAGNFNGGTSVLTKAGGLTGYDGLPGFSYAAWVNRSSLDGAFSGIVSQDPAGGACCTNRFLFDPADHPYFDAGAHADASLPLVTLANDSWHHVVMTADDSIGGNQVNIYIDGALAGTHNFAHNLANGSAFDTFVGAGENGGAHHLQGLLDDVQVFDGVLSADQVNNLFQFGQLEVPEPASVALWSLIGVGALIEVAARRRRR